MKKAISILFILAIALPAMADGVSQQKATDAAAAFFGARAQTRAGVTPQLVWTGGENTRSPYAPPFYVFNNPEGGWVMISGEDAGRAVLGSSDQGSFDPDNIPENAAAWFAEYANQIQWIRTRGIAQDEAAAREWADLLEGRIQRKVTDEKRLATALWGQGRPYNNKCPRIASDGTVVYEGASGFPTRTSTGCVATSTAIVMQWHKHPAQGTGSIGGYSKYIKSADIDPSPTAPTVDLDEDTAGYDWENMPTEADDLGSYTSVQQDAVAKLMFHAGLATEMQYGTGGSSSYQYKIYGALVDHFGYDPSMQRLARNGHSDSDWLQIIKDEIDADRPIIVSGHNSSNGGGHEFVAEGYSGNSIYINWGWGGSNNGLFGLSAFAYSSHDFRYTQSILVGIKPKTTPAGAAAINLTLYGSSGFKLYSGVPDPDNPTTYFQVAFRVASQTDTEMPACSLRVYVVDYSNNLKAISSNQPQTVVPQYSTGKGADGWPCNFRHCTAEKNALLKLGDKLMLCYERVSGDASSSVPIYEKWGDHLYSSASKYNNNIPVFDEPFIKVKDGGVYSVGELFDCEIINTREIPANMSVSWSLIDGNGSETALAIDPASFQNSTRLTASGDFTVKAVITYGEDSALYGETLTLKQKIRVQ